MLTSWENELSEAARWWNTKRPLTHSLDSTEEGLAMKATRTCSIPDCDRPNRARGWCGMHYMRWDRTGDPTRVEPVHHNFVGDQIGYRGAHLRVKTQRGKASSYQCQHCGSPALHWAYDNDDPNERRHADGRRYSPDPAHYLPLCVPCHSQHDASARAAS